MVDDNADAAETLARLVGAMDHDSRFLTDPRQVLPLAADFRPHVVFLDLGMPRVDGFEVCHELRRKFGFEDLCIVAVTGYGTETHRAKSRVAGFDAHLLKPASPELVKATLEELCEPRGWQA